MKTTDRIYNDRPETGSFYHLQVASIKPCEHPAFAIKCDTGGHSRILCGQWSGSAKNGVAAPPEIGTRVKVTFNGLGTGEVVGYFLESGYIGVEIKPDKRPEWHVKQNGDKGKHYLVFGAEVNREIIQAAPVAQLTSAN